MRWTELGAFTPFMRTHDGDDRENNHRWDSDADTTAHFSRMARVHAALAPDRIAWAEEAESSGLPLVRHLLLEFPEDQEAWTVHDQYMFGPELLVAPVVEQAATSRSVYFPEGKWFSVWDVRSFEGPGYHEVTAPIGTPPVFSRGQERTDLRSIQ
jgi:alpha-glucosidase